MFSHHSHVHRPFRFAIALLFNREILLISFTM